MQEKNKLNNNKKKNHLPFEFNIKEQTIENSCGISEENGLIFSFSLNINPLNVLLFIDIKTA